MNRVRRYSVELVMLALTLAALGCAHRTKPQVPIEDVELGDDVPEAVRAAFLIAPPEEAPLALAAESLTPQVVARATSLAVAGPPIFRPGPVTIRAEGSRVTLANGTVITKDQYGKPINPELDVAYAIDNAHPGDVIGLAPGFHRALIGYGDTNKADVASWPGFAVVRDVTIVSLDPANRARVNFGVAGDVTRPGMGGVDGLTLSGVTLYNRTSDKYGFLVYLGTTQGLIRFQDIDTLSQTPSAWGGGGVMTWIRTHGWCRIIIDGMRCTRAKEHDAYIDAPQGDSYIFDLVALEPTGRTTVHVVERMDPGGYGGYTTYPTNGVTRRSQGMLVIRRVKGWVENFGGGGSGVTVAGHSGGPVFVDAGQEHGTTGGLVVWGDSGKGLAKTANGFICPLFVLGDFKATFPAGDRDIVAISGCERVEISLSSSSSGAPLSVFNGNRTALSLDNQFGGPVKNGTVLFHCAGKVSTYAGWQAGAKVKKGSGNVVLSAAQLDAMNAGVVVLP